jgi:tetratricopeptide (TPR) repeat protein
MAAFANDPEEVKIQYDLYRIEFDGGKGGTPVPIAGASNNGMSNSFPKISPDGKWVVYVQAMNGQLMRPDSKLWIVPAKGGTPRLMNCNTALMNSWHSFSPNGRWLVFSSKSRSPYTQMFLTHIDADGNDSPAILIENSTAANRAVNIPEFVNMDPAGIDHIDTPAVDFYKQYDVAAELARKEQYQAAIPEWEKALSMSPADARTHNNFGQTLVHAGKAGAAIAEFRKAIAAKPVYPEAQSNLAIALAGAGQPSEAIEHFKLAIEANPGFAEAHSNLGHVLAEQGRIPEAIEEYEKALEVNPEYAEAHNNLGFALASAGRMDEAIEQYNLALKSDPKYAHAYNNLGLALAIQGKVDDAIGEFQKAIELDGEYAAAEGNLGHALEEKDRFDEAIEHLMRALTIGPDSAEIEKNLGLALAEKGKVDDSIPHFQRAIALSSRMAEAHAYLGTAMVIKGNRTEARAEWREALQSEPNNVRVLNDLSWLLSTAPEPALRNGAEAVRLASRGVELTHQQDPMLLGTLAAAFAEAGDFSQAVSTEQRAAELARNGGNSQLGMLLESRLALFQQHTPVRQR